MCFLVPLMDLLTSPGPQAGQPSGKEPSRLAQVSVSLLHLFKIN